MNILKTIALCLLSFVLIVTLTVAIFAGSVQILLYPAVYEKALENGGVYEEIDRQLAGHIPIPVGPAIRILIKDMLDNFLAYMRSDTNILNLTISAGMVKDIIVDGINELPVCAGNQNMFIGMIGGNVTCRPPGIEPAQIADAALANQTLPSIDLAAMINGENNLAGIRGMIALFRNVLSMVLLIVLAALFLIICITRHSVKSLLRWVGANMIITGVIAMASLIVQEKLLAMIPPDAALDVVVAVATELLAAVFDRIALYGGVLLGAGILMILFSLTIDRISKMTGKKK